MTNLPACVRGFGCLCARHAIQGEIAALEPCDASESPADWWTLAELASKDGAFLASLPAAIDLNSHDPVDRCRAYSPKDVVLAIRRDLKLAVKAGLIPTHAKFSVTRERKSIDVVLVAWQGAVLHAGYIEIYMAALTNGQKDGPTADQMEPIMSRLGLEWNRREGADARMIDAINNVMWLVERIADRHNYDHSDSMVDHFDIGYYLSISARGLIAFAETGLRLEIDPATREFLRRAHDAANRVGPKVVRSVCGKGGVDNCSEYQIERLFKLDAKADGRPLVYNGRGWVVDDTAPVPVKSATSETK